MKAKGGSPSMDVLDLLGNQLVLDPEALALLKQEGKVSEGEFAALMEALGENVSNGEGNTESLLGESKKINPELISKDNSLAKVPMKEGEQHLSGKGESKLNLESLNSTPKDLSKAQAQLAPQKGETTNPLKEIIANQKPVAAEVNIEKVRQTPAKSDVESAKNPNLVKLSEFMEKQNASTQKRFLQSGGYEAPKKSMFLDKVEATSEMAKTGAQSSAKAVTLQDLMFASGDDTNMESSDQNQSQNLLNQSKINTVSTDSAKVFDMNQLMGDKSINSENVISRIQDYIIQTRAGNEKQVEMSFMHKDLGEVGLQVQKHTGDSIGITISTASLEGAKFFTQNQGELLQTLNQAGIQVGDFKLDTSKSGTANQDSNSDSQKQFAGNNKQQSQSESGERKQEQDRRKSLWEQFSEQQVAA